MLPILLFALFALVGSFYVLHGLGGKVSERLRVQQAADRSAHSAAAVNARALNMLTYLNSTLVAMEAVRAVHAGIREAYGYPNRGVMGSAEAHRAHAEREYNSCRLPNRRSYYYRPCRRCGRRFNARAYRNAMNRYHNCRSHWRGQMNRFRAIFQTMRNAWGGINSKISSKGQEVTANITAAEELGQALVAHTREWAHESAQEVAVLHNRATDFRLSPVAGRPIPVQLSGDSGVRERVRRVALSNYFEGPIVGGRSDVFDWSASPWSPGARSQFEAGIRNQIPEINRPLWELPSGDATEWRRDWVQTTFVTLGGATGRLNRDKLRKFRAAGVKRKRTLGGESADLSAVAMARAEPYFALNGGVPDGRPGWSARLRPLTLDSADLSPGEPSSFVTAVAEAAQTARWVADWVPYVEALRQVRHEPPH